MGRRKITTEQFIERAHAVHGFEYDYTVTRVLGSTVPVNIRCRTHGVFQKTPGNHVNLAQGCPKCSKAATVVYVAQTTCNAEAKIGITSSTKTRATQYYYMWAVDFKDPLLAMAAEKAVKVHFKKDVVRGKEWFNSDMYSTLVEHVEKLHKLMT